MADLGSKGKEVQLVHQDYPGLREKEACQDWKANQGSQDFLDPKAFQVWQDPKEIQAPLGHLVYLDQWAHQDLKVQQESVVGQVLEDHLEYLV